MVIEATRARTKQPELRREQLLNAAERLFSEKGFSETTVSDIAEAAGVAKGTFYLYFPSKEAAAAALKERLAQGMGDRFLEVLDPAMETIENATPEAIRDMVRLLIDESFSYCEEHLDAFKNLFHRTDFISQDEHMEAEEPLIISLSWVMTRLNETGLVHVSHPEHTMRILFTGVHWALKHIMSGTNVSKEKVEELKQAAIEVCVRALGIPEN